MRWCTSITVSRPTVRPGAPLLSWCWSKCLSVRAGRLVGVQVGFGEKALQSQVKVAGGIWDPVFRLWKLPLRAARQLGLSDRVRALEE